MSAKMAQSGTPPNAPSFDMRAMTEDWTPPPRLMTVSRFMAPNVLVVLGAPQQVLTPSQLLGEVEEGEEVGRAGSCARPPTPHTAGVDAQTTGQLAPGEPGPVLESLQT